MDHLFRAVGDRRQWTRRCARANGLLFRPRRTRGLPARRGPPARPPGPVAQAGPPRRRRPDFGPGLFSPCFPRVGAPSPRLPPSPPRQEHAGANQNCPPPSKRRKTPQRPPHRGTRTKKKTPMTPPPAAPPPYKHTPLFRLGTDTAPYRKLTADGVRVERVGGHDFV